MPECERFSPDKLSQQIDFIVCVGGDGTALKAASYFDDAGPIPPTLALGMGSLGFLAPFNMDQAKGMLSRILSAGQEPVPVTLRTRLKGEVYSRQGQMTGTFFSLNEFIVNRGLSGVLSTLQIFVDDILVTTAQVRSAWCCRTPTARLAFKGRG